MIHDFISPGDQQSAMSFSLPQGCVARDGTLDLVWQARPFRVYSEGIAWFIVEPA